MTSVRKRSIGTGEALLKCIYTSKEDFWLDHVYNVCKLRRVLIFRDSTKDSDKLLNAICKLTNSPANNCETHWRYFLPCVLKVFFFRGEAAIDITANDRDFVADVHSFSAKATTTKKPSGTLGRYFVTIESNCFIMRSTSLFSIFKLLSDSSGERSAIQSHKSVLTTILANYVSGEYYWFAVKPQNRPLFVGRSCRSRGVLSANETW